MPIGPRAIPRLLLIFLLALALQACEETSSDSPQHTQGENTLFRTISPSQSGIDFQNILVETEASNYYQYMYSYIGGGVAAADFDNDGLEDLFFVSNSADNKLYHNQGDFQFKDITESAGIKQEPGFDAGVTVADVNNDGYVDIYICRGGWIDTDNRFANLLYINQGDLSFKEQAEEYGLSDQNRSITSTFFDYDKDGDLDLYLANSPDFEDRAAEVVDLAGIATDPETPAQKGSDKLYQNDGTGHFSDVSIAAGILPDIGFGLNAQIGDLNNDTWLDIYVCNDFRIPDFVYLNNGDGTFREGRNEVLKHLSFNSMGGDIADINNDGYLDIYTLDMNPEDYVRSKTTMGMTSLDRFQQMVDKGYHYNYMHNMLQLNNGNGTFSEIAQMAGVANTDWSWACLLADFDLDGHNDIYVTNGVFRDVIDRDANNAILKILRENGRKPTDADFLAFTKMLPQQKLTNYFFRNMGDLTFENVSSAWADSVPSFSNGAIYADLDNDGDLDVAVNNINSPATILKNTAVEQAKGSYLQIKLAGPEKNLEGIGAIVKIQLADGSTLMRQQIRSRGFLSAVSATLHVGLGNIDSISSMEVIWPDGKWQELSDISANQILNISYKNAESSEKTRQSIDRKLLFTQIQHKYSHIDPASNDYEKQILLPHKLSQTGPAIAKADVNGDEIEDIYLGGGHTQAGQLLLGSHSGDFREKPISDFVRDRQREDIAACFFDADNDGDVDLYVVSGSYEFRPNSKLLLDRLYMNDGKGNFTKSSGIIPDIVSAGAVVVAGDIDKDGDEDLFVGGRVIPGSYPYAPQSFLLQNNEGRFSIANTAIAPELTEIGMITDAEWTDIDEDDDLDLLLTGEWMGIEIFVNEQGKLGRSEAYSHLSSHKGWWNELLIADIDQDGDQDIIAGNLGLNYKFHATEEKPFHVYTHDFDFNGTTDVILAKKYKGAEVPVRGKTCATQQIPHLAQKISSFNDFASRDLEGILGPAIKSALHYEATEFRTGIFVNEGEEGFRFSPLPHAAQQSPINGILYADFDGDGTKDLLIAGNNYMSEVETTRADAGTGLFMKGNGNGDFEAISHLTSGFFANKDVRDMVHLSHPKGDMIIVANNHDTHDIFIQN